MKPAREQLREWLTRAKLTQRAAARAFGMHYTFLSQILNSDRSPALATAVRLERITGIPVEAWLTTDDDVHLTAAGGTGRKRKSA